MNGINKAILIGRCGKDPETRALSNGDSVTNLSLATSESWKDKSGNKQEKTTWHNVTFFGKLATIVADYVKKGSLIYVEGRVQTDKWTDKDGNDRYTTKIIAREMQILSSKGDNAKSDSVESQSPANDFDDSDIPF